MVFSNYLEIGKVAGPDMLRPLLLKELSEEIVPIIKVIVHFWKVSPNTETPSDLVQS